MTANSDFIVTRTQASSRLIEAAHRMFADSSDDLALLAVVGAALTGAFEELDIKALNAADEHPLKGFFAKDNDGFSRWFNFLKHGSRGARSPGDQFDFSFLGEQPERDLHLFGLIWQAALYHLSAYEESSELIDSVLLVGNVLWGYEDDEWAAGDKSVFEGNIRGLAKAWYSRHERADVNGIDLALSQQTARDAFSGPVAGLLRSVPKMPIRNRSAKKR